MGAGPAQRLGVHGLAGSALHQVGAAKPHEAGAVDHEDDVGEGRQVGAAGDTASHDGADLRHPQVSPHDRVVVEQPGRAVLAGKDPALVRQVHPGAVHKVDDGDVLAHGHFLRPEHLLDRLGPPGAGLHRGVVGHHDDLAALHHPDPGNDPGAGCLPVVFVVRHQQADLQPGRARIQQLLHPLAGREPPLLMHLGGAGRSPALPQAGDEEPVLVGKDAQPVGPGSRGWRLHTAIGRCDRRPTRRCSPPGQRSVSRDRTAGRCPGPGATPCPPAG